MRGEEDDDVAGGERRAVVQRAAERERLRRQVLDTHLVAREHVERAVAGSRVERQHLERRCARLAEDRVEHRAEVRGLVAAADHDRDGGFPHGREEGRKNARNRTARRIAGW